MTISAPSLTGRNVGTAKSDRPVQASEPPPPEVMLDLRNIHKSFGELPVLRGVTIRVAKGDVIGIIGPSGSGKTTLLRCVNYLITPDQGEVWLDGELIGRDNQRRKRFNSLEGSLRHYRAEIGFVFQDFNLFPHMTVLKISLRPR